MRVKKYFDYCMPKMLFLTNQCKCITTHRLYFLIASITHGWPFRFTISKTADRPMK